MKIKEKCPECKGEGRVPIFYNDGDIDVDMCECCCGEGEIEVEVGEHPDKEAK